jgi:glutaredoxin
MTVLWSRRWRCIQMQDAGRTFAETYPWRTDMKVELAVTRTCMHCPILEKEFKRLGVPYSIRYIEDDVELQKKHNLRGSPNIIVDDELVFRGMPEISELKKFFREKGHKVLV